MCRTSSSPDCNQCIRKLLWQPLKENLRYSILHRSSKASILCAGCCWTVHAVPLPQCHRMTLQSILRPLTPWKKCPRLEAMLLPRHGGHPYPLGIPSGCACHIRGGMGQSFLLGLPLLLLCVTPLGAEAEMHLWPSSFSPQTHSGT
jgi:hypothetical protein